MPSSNTSCYFSQFTVRQRNKHLPQDNRTHSSKPQINQIYFPNTRWKRCTILVFRFDNDSIVAFHICSCQFRSFSSQFFWLLMLCLQAKSLTCFYSIARLPYCFLFYLLPVANQTRHMQSKAFICIRIYV